jgi:predicted PurR-regulated permease PerM
MDDQLARIRSQVPADEADRVEVAQRELARRRFDAGTTALIILATLAIFYTFYVTAELTVPIVFAVMLKMLLQPVMDVLTRRLRLPAMVAALCLVIALLGGIGGIGYSLSAPASSWLEKAPQSMAVLEQRLEFIRQPLAMLQWATQRLESVAAAGNPQQAIVVKDAGIGGFLFRGTRTVLAQLVTMVVVLFFLLAAGDTFLRRLVEILPSFSDKKRAVEIVAEVEENLSIYLLTITTMNLAVGTATGLVMWACGVADPVLWGAFAFLLNYVPILGPLTGVVSFFLVGLLSFSSAWLALIPAGAYLAIHIAEGEIITPMLLAHRFTLNPVIVIVSLFFWYWMWGVPGALLAVPLLATAKIVCDRFPPLVPLGHLLGSSGPLGDNHGGPLT